MALLSKRGQGISINMIIVAAIALVVLIVLIVIFTGKTQQFNRGLGSCKGICATSPAQCSGAAIPVQNCNDGNQQLQGDSYCCIAQT